MNNKEFKLVHIKGYWYIKKNNEIIAAIKNKERALEKYEALCMN